ncbi:16S rRNA (cytosine(1402)-N(4))-methyltransferase RsmH, partial [Alphaproteobacteria bacterium]|nr:16S rRNA (cytosine(1402)-N(4))-methyltransferase RsmH [Alphaproteobacteria bacterium]
MNNFLEHIPVLLDEILENLKKFKITNGIIIDATFGLGGYSNAILEKTNCDVYGFDRDPDVLKYANKLKKKYKNRFKFFQKKFSDIDDILSKQNYSKKKVKGMIFDLGVSNLQLTKKNRGFSFKLNGPLDMRMSKEGMKALDVINNYSAEKLSDIFYNFGDEFFSRRVARHIVKLREITPISTTLELADIIRKAIPGKQKKIDKATKSFQAIRMFINDEISELNKGLIASEKFLTYEGILCVVSFHSKEDKIVKNFLNVCQG